MNKIDHSQPLEYASALPLKPDPVRSIEDSFRAVQQIAARERDKKNRFAKSPTASVRVSQHTPEQIARAQELASRIIGEGSSDE